MPSISIPAAIVGSAAIAGGAGLISGGMQAGAAKDAASMQYDAAQQAQAMQWQMFQTMQGNLSPYMMTGQNSLNNLSMLTGNSPTMSPEVQQWQQQLQMAQQALSALPTGTATTGGTTTGSSGLSPLASAAGGMLLGGVPGSLIQQGSTSGSLMQSPVAGSISQPNVSAGAGGLPGDAAGLQSMIADLQSKINTAKMGATPGNPLTAPLTAPFNPTMAQLEQTPGYQFTLNQGLRATQNAATSMGLGQSGPAIAAAGDYATGLASQTYQQNFNNYWSNNQNLYNMVAGLATMGQNAAAGVGTAGIQTAQASGNMLTGGAAALGAGQVGAANAWGGALSSVGGNAGNAAMMLAMNNNGLFGSPTAAAPAGGSYAYGGAAGFQPAGSWSPEGWAY